MYEQIPQHIAAPNPDVYLSRNFLVVDFETTNKNKGDPTEDANHLVLTVIWHSVTGLHVKWGNEYEVAVWLDNHIKSVDFVVAHNVKFELGWFKRCGIDLTEVVVYDTLIGKYVQDGNRHSVRKLNNLAANYNLGCKQHYVSYLIESGVCPSEIPARLLEQYCIKDVELCRDVFFIQRDELKDAGQLNLVYTRCLLTPVLTDLESNGMCLDKYWVREYAREFERVRKEAFSELAASAEGVNFNSPKQVAELLYGRLGFTPPRDWRGKPITTDSGALPTDADTISRLPATTESQRTFIRNYQRYKKVNGTLTKYLKKFQECCRDNDGILNCNFNQTVTKTHRLSSSGKTYKVQFQNFDRNLKPLFKARKKGWSIGDADGAQLEFRVAAYSGRDRRAEADIKEGFDVHQNTADTLTEAGEPTGRQEAKEHTFKPLYGGSSGTDAQQAYYAAFKERYPDLTSTQDTWCEEVLNTGQLVLETGLVCYWPGTTISRKGYISNSTKIKNLPVQNLATAEIIPIAVTYLWHRMKAHKMKSFLVNTVHDSAVGEIHPKERELFTKLVVQSFTTDVYNYLKTIYNIDFYIPLDADVEFKTNWG